MADWFNIPMMAIGAFEKVTGLRITIHEVSGALWAFLPPERYIHTHPVCIAAKAQDMAACVRFDVVQTRAALSEQPAGRVHMCHAGLVEWVVPTIRMGQLQRVFFAGQRRPGPNFTGHQAPQVAHPPEWAKRIAALDPVNDDEAAWILELLRQLAARIELWDSNPPPTTLEVSAASISMKRRTARALRDNLLKRQQLIQYFIQGNHTKPIGMADVAKLLHLSESRAGHAVKQACGRSFMELVLDARLRTVAGLLQNTNLSVSDIAEASGFHNASHFHHTFRRQFKTTPHQYRQQARHKLQVLSHHQVDVKLPIINE